MTPHRTVGSRQSAVGRMQEAAGSSKTRNRLSTFLFGSPCRVPSLQSLLPTAYCLLPTVFCLLLFVCGCTQLKAPGTAGYRTVPQDPRRDPEAAMAHNAKAVEMLAGKQYDEAEKELKAALAADLFCGPAHNNLGAVYFHKRKLYLAAWEFQYAVKLMPAKAEPKNNLGMILEAVGKLDEAAKCYEDALKQEPDAIEITGNLARVCIRANRRDEKTRQLLSDIILKDPRIEWVSWAKERLSTGKPQAPDPAPATIPEPKE